MEFYDWVLVFALGNPLLNAYDLIFLLPCLLHDRRRIGVALTAGVVAWAFAFVAGRFSMSLLVTLVLLVERLWRVERPRAATA